MGIVSRLFYKTTGLMPRREIVRTCKDIGKQLANECKAGGIVDVKRVSELLTERIGTKNAKNIVVADDFDTFKRYTDSLGLDENLANYFFQGSKSTVLPNPKDKSILLSLRLGDMPINEALNTTTHELEHVLFKRLSPKAAFDKLYIKLRGQKWVDNYTQKHAAKMNEAQMDLQQGLLMKSRLGITALNGRTVHPLTTEGLLKQMELPDEKALERTLRNLVQKGYIEGDLKGTQRIMKVFRGILKDESRAYKCGGATEQYWDKITGNAAQGATKSDMLASLYDKTLDVVKKELKQVRKERLKSFFGIKPKDKVTYQDGFKITERTFLGKKYQITEKEITDAEIPENLKGLI